METDIEPIRFLRLYVDPAWQQGGAYSSLLYPFWGNPHTESAFFRKQLFDTYSFDTALYGITDDITQADMVLAPFVHQWCVQNDPHLLGLPVAVAQKAGLPLLIDGMGDVEFPINLPNTFVLRIGGYRFLPEKNRIQVSPGADDLLERCQGGQLSLRAKQMGKPIVGFAGWAELSPVQTMRTVTKELPVRLRGIFDARYRACTKGVLWRKKAIEILQRSPAIDLNLRVRKTFSGNTKTAEKDLPTLRQEMVDTILGSDYSLDVRGDANESGRFYEILSLGRIPVAIDTERNFPFSDVIDYDSFCLRIDFRDIANMPRRILEFHQSISPERFQEMQKNARRAFVGHFRVDAQMKHVLRQINELRIKEKSSPK